MDHRASAGFHYYHLRLGKFGVCMCGTKADIRDDGSCVSKLVEQVKTNAVPRPARGKWLVF